jgi:hypothetical protein
MNETDIEERLERAASHVTPSRAPLAAIERQAHGRRSRTRATFGVALLLVAGTSWALWAGEGSATTDRGLDPATTTSGPTPTSTLSPIPVPPVPSGVTADGRTYGGASRDGDNPDLLAVAVDGDGDGTRDDAVAFANTADLNADGATNPDHPLQGWRDAPNGYLIPLYATDGTTVVATFASGEPESDAMAVVAEQAPPGAVRQEVSGSITVEDDCPYLDGPDGKHWLILPWGWHLSADGNGYDDADGRRVTDFDSADLTVKVLPGQQSIICPTGMPPYYVTG